MDYTRKNFVKGLVPSFIREEYPIFIEFIESYYDYLDRKKGQLTNVVVLDAGKNYSDNPTVEFWVLASNGTYYIPDTKGAAAEAVVVNGRIEKIIVTSFGSGYTQEDAVMVGISDPTGTGANTRANVFTDYGNINELTKQLITARDIDTEVPLFVEFLKNEFIPKIPNKLYSYDTASVEVTKLVKFIKSFYTSVGVENSIKFLYRILFNTDVSVYYPKTDMLRVSDGKWTVDKLLTVSSPEDILSYAGKKIISLSGITGIIQSVIPDPSGTPDLYVLNITDNLSPFTVGDSVGLYNFALTNIDYFGTVINYAVTNGYYIGDDGQLSSRKRIQDSYYYQDFSYELQSDQTITEFKNLLETLIHPAGLKYFIRLNIISTSEAGINLSVDKESNLVRYADRNYESESFSSLGPRYLDVERNMFATSPSFYQDFIINGVTPATADPTITSININSNEYNSDAFIGYTALINTGATGFIRTVAGYLGATGFDSRMITLDSEIDGFTSASVRLIENFRPKSVSNIAGATGPYIQLSSYHIGSTGLTSGLTGPATGSTGIYNNFRLYITTGPGSTDSKIIQRHVGDRLYIESPFSTTPTTDSTYYIHPDGYGATGVYTGFLESIQIVDGGINYDAGVNTITVSSPLDGVTATAEISSVGPSGEILAIEITEPGFGYITTPTVTIDGATGIGAIIYPVLSNVSSSYSSLFNKVSLEGGVKLHVPDIKNKFVAATLYCNVNNGVVAEVLIDNPGSGYMYIPTYYTYGGEGTGVAFDISISSEGQPTLLSPWDEAFDDVFGEIFGSGILSGAILTNLGSDYYNAPLIKVEAPYPKPGEKIYQITTGARGVIDMYDKDLDTLYIFKDYDSAEFDESPITYFNVIINVDLVLGTYETKEKKINVVSDAEITSVKV